MVGQLEFILKKIKKLKWKKVLKKCLKRKKNLVLKNFKTYKDFGEKIYKIRENVIRNIKKLKNKNKLIIGYGAPAKATTALNFFGISKEIDFIVEDNKLKT